METHEQPSTSHAISRREVMKRGAVVGGTLLWAAPVVQTLTMRPAFADHVSGHVPAISFIAVNVSCDFGQGEEHFFLKAECPDPGGGTCAFEVDPGGFRNNCPAFQPVGDPIPSDQDLSAHGFSVSAPDEDDGCVNITVPAGCLIVDAVVKGAQDCCPVAGFFPGSTGQHTVRFCPTTC